MDEELKNKIAKSGTSILGIVCKDGIVMASDRRVTAGGSIIIAKNEQKAVPINDYVLLAGTGNASDIQMLQKITAAELKLKELKSKERPSVKEAANLIGMISYRNIRTPSMIPNIAGTLIGGVNEDETTELYTVEPAGSVIKVEDFDANFSSGMPYILGLLERQYKKEMKIEDGIKLAVECIKSSTQRDVGSGNGIDVFAITRDGIKHVVKQEIGATYT